VCAAGRANEKARPALTARGKSSSGLLRALRAAAEPLRRPGRSDHRLLRWRGREGARAEQRGVVGNARQGGRGGKGESLEIVLSILYRQQFIFKLSNDIELQERSPFLKDGACFPSTGAPLHTSRPTPRRCRSTRAVRHR
jgi:hypothetical protein